MQRVQQEHTPHVRYRRIWSGSDSDFVPSPKPPVGNDSPTAKWGVKRRKTGVTSTSGKKNITSVTKSNARAGEFIARASPSPPRYPRSELVVPLSIRHARKAGTADDFAAPQHLSVVRRLHQGPNEDESLQLAEALRNTKHSSNAKDRVKSKHVARPLAILAEQMTTEKAKTDISKREARERLISKWLIPHGLPFTVCASVSFFEVLQAATGNPAYPRLSRDRHNRLLNGQLQLFCELGERIAIYWVRERMPSQVPESDP
ncbi:hypothetical protein GQ600_9631 [Phytophthora cactorum]|nr:hypothetical protein GQ600_9631 [Phytophthora cactorum]